MFAVTGSYPVGTEDAKEALAAWQSTLERALTDTLNPLIDAFGRAVREHPDSTIENRGISRIAT